ncbi:hypothetical protein CAPTEDRAFT_184012 [Capitella teleta]|uniref:GPI ethanolamine phosphate transferase 1 n=2 Tax=Capitella teleta TaxID=283909 RepID=R7U986_CAPTE|nr:hypothetical protein CAPTEDRAFT_184012 [Capitella teleta]|eukprot:ELT99695.1 hypothetical protein CAPTEDRAFT_184012 [Capitella teleta]
MDWRLLVSGFLVNLVFFYSIFDIYFTSPLVHGMRPVSVPSEAPAKRLVLFVADGLRADKFFELDANRKSRAPFLRSVIEETGAWGISHTRVPTESRPGHVALIAGFYEDVSAVAKGWKENPVDFDSVFNQSRETWSWGSPDILPMFAKGASGDHVHVHMYPEQSEDFAGANLKNLDLWVFEKLKVCSAALVNSPWLFVSLHSDKIVFFLHLLGLDTNGHAHNPLSREYLDNIGVVDKGIKEINDLFKDFYRDDKTAFVFSADHGMTNWGSHGAGHPSETLTPLVVWGAGVRHAKPAHSQQRYPDAYSNEWSLSHVHRTDVNQADIAPLMSCLVGLPFPLNSVGILPLDLLSVDDKFKAQSIYANAQQIIAQFDIKMQQKKDSTLRLLFRPFSPLAPAAEEEKLLQIHQLIQAANYTGAIIECQSLIKLSLEGLNYYHNYDKLFLGVSIASGYIGWMAHILIRIIQNHTNLPHAKHAGIPASFWLSAKGLRIISGCLTTVVLCLLYVQSLPWTYYVYCCLPLALWHKVIQRWRFIREVFWYLNDHGLWKDVALFSLLSVAALEIIVLSFFYRELLSVALVSMAIWIIIRRDSLHDQSLVVRWSIACLVMSVFPLMPVVGRDANFPLVYAAGILTIVASLLFQRCVFFVFLTVLSACVILKWYTCHSLHTKEGLPILNQVLSWSSLVLSVVTPLLAPTQLNIRLMHIVLAFFPCYLLLSTAQEGLFLLALTVLLHLWLQVETQVTSIRIRTKVRDVDFRSAVRLGEVQRKLSLSDIRCAYFFIFFLLNGFLGTGNIASINTFDPQSVLPFLTVFSPFVMGALMMWKNLLPLLLVTCAFEGVRLCINVPMQSLFLTVLFMSDFMALNFFFLVRDEGSWLEIGTSISHYVIVMCLILFLMILLLLSRFFTSFSPRAKSKGL